MTEAEEKVLGIKDLPIFPLPLVLLPNELLPLHIFEPRYRKMLKDIEAARNLFGVTYFEPQESFGEVPAVGSVGCVAEVREVQTLEDGRSNILTIGVIRYRLLGYIETGEHYLTAEIDFFEDDFEDESVLAPLAARVFDLFKRIASAAHKLSDQRGSLPELPPTDPQSLSFLVTAAFSLEPAVKLRLLEMRSTVDRLKQLEEYLVKAVDKMEESADVHKKSQTNGHFKRKIEL